jgi:hypothetical protein
MQHLIDAQLNALLATLGIKIVKKMDVLPGLKDLY